VKDVATVFAEKRWDFAAKGISASQEKPKRYQIPNIANICQMDT
jgi:hypothetical protein